MPRNGRFVDICCAGSQTIENNRINDKQTYFNPSKTEANQNYI